MTACGADVIVSIIMENQKPARSVMPSIVCEEAVASYRVHGRTIQVPAIRKLLESVIRQKAEHVAILRTVDSLSDTHFLRIAAFGPEPADALAAIVGHETSFAASLDSFAASLPEQDDSRSVKAIADSGRKFASWAQDHLDLLALF